MSRIQQLVAFGAKWQLPESTDSGYDLEAHCGVNTYGIRVEDPGAAHPYTLISLIDGRKRIEEPLDYLPEKTPAIAA